MSLKGTRCLGGKAALIDDLSNNYKPDHNLSWYHLCFKLSTNYTQIWSATHIPMLYTLQESGTKEGHMLLQLMIMEG